MSEAGPGVTLLLSPSHVLCHLLLCPLSGNWGSLRCCPLTPRVCEVGSSGAIPTGLWFDQYLFPQIGSQTSLFSPSRVACAEGHATPSHTSLLWGSHLRLSPLASAHSPCVPLAKRRAALPSLAPVGPRNTQSRRSPMHTPEEPRPPRVHRVHSLKQWAALEKMSPRQGDRNSSF